MVYATARAHAQNPQDHLQEARSQGTHSSGTTRYASCDAMHSGAYTAQLSLSSFGCVHLTSVERLWGSAHQSALNITPQSEPLFPPFSMANPQTRTKAAPAQPPNAAARAATPPTPTTPSPLTATRQSSSCRPSARRAAPLPPSTPPCCTPTCSPPSACSSPTSCWASTSCQVGAHNPCACC